MKNPLPKMTSFTGSETFSVQQQKHQTWMEINSLYVKVKFGYMDYRQCRIKNVVSVGARANSLKSLIEQAKEFLDSFQYLVIVSDDVVSRRQHGQTLRGAVRGEG